MKEITNILLKPSLWDLILLFTAQNPHEGPDLTVCYDSKRQSMPWGIPFKGTISLSTVYGSD
jgi:hypothetical protein